MGMSYLELTQSLANAFNALADETQSLNDRRVVLEHKLRFAHEQVSKDNFLLLLQTELIMRALRLPPMSFRCCQRLRR